VRARRKAEKLTAAGNSNFLAPPNTTASVGAGRKMRKAAGWRGLSVDLITHPEENALVRNDTGSGSFESMDSNETEDVKPDDRLDGYTVKRIWTCSKLESSKLRDIWGDCDPDHSGSLDLDAFVKGMWRIDEELRRARLGPGSSKRPARRSTSNLLAR